MLLRKTILVAAAVLALAGCSGTPSNPLPTYPQSGLLTTVGGQTELETGTVRMTMYQTRDTPDQVADFYNQELGSREGWKGGYTKGERFGRWSDGNITAKGEGFDDPSTGKYTPKDPSKPGGYVQLIKGSTSSERDPGCLIKLVHYAPKGS